MTAAELVSAAHEDFREFVTSQVGPSADSVTWETLTSPLLVSRTRSVLVALHQDLLSQLAQANEDLGKIRTDGLQDGDAGKARYYAAKSGQAEWRKRTMSFKRMVERRMGQAKGAAQQHAAKRSVNPPGLTVAVRRHNLLALERLARAVYAHEESVTSGQGDSGDDDKLWDALDDITMMTGHDGGGEFPLRDWLNWLDERREEEAQI